MHTVGHARYIAFSMMKEDASKRVHAIQNDLVKQLNSVMFDLAMHTEEMRKWGFPSGEASRKLVLSRRQMKAPLCIALTHLCSSSLTTGGDRIAPVSSVLATAV